MMATRRKAVLLKPGTKIKGRIILDVAIRKLRQQRSTYRVLNLDCGHESMITHKTLVDKKKSHRGLCLRCTRQEQGRTLSRQLKLQKAKATLKIILNGKHTPERNPDKKWADYKQGILGDHNCAFYRKALALRGTES